MKRVDLPPEYRIEFFGRGKTLQETLVNFLGGQALCLLLTLVVTPVAYSLFDDAANLSFLRDWRERFERKEDRFWGWLKHRKPAASPGSGEKRDG